MEWQQEYEKELKRTSGKHGFLTYRGGGWWAIYFPQRDTNFVPKRRKPQIIKMTKVLKKRASYKLVAIQNETRTEPPDRKLPGE